MARECKRKRDERRFGKAERLADQIIGTDPTSWKIGTLVYHAVEKDQAKMVPAVQKSIDIFRDDVSESTVVSADNVASYYYLSPKCVWVWDTDFPCSAPSFEKMFVEFRLPPEIVVERGERRSSADLPSQAGCLFTFIDAASVGYCYPRVDSGGSLSVVKLSEAQWFCRAEIVVSKNLVPIYMGVYRWFPIGLDGRIIESPPAIVTGGEFLTEEERKVVDSDLFLIPAVLTLSFMNCKNAVLSVAEPDKALNKERKKAKLKPFVRYHTINIEPMKKVLRTEGQVETQGLKKALHICRGHFATYTEDRKLFGKVAGTFWVPAHVRGSIKEGVVISDYKVNPPKAEEP